MKKAAMQAYNNSSPTAWMIGEVISESPLLIQIEQRLTIDEDLLILTRNVTDYMVQATIGLNLSTGSSEGHRHSVSGTHNVPLTIHNGLQEGDMVLLLRQDGGQKFIVIDRVVI